jgi:hypothetical protein
MMQIKKEVSISKQNSKTLKHVTDNICLKILRQSN